MGGVKNNNNNNNNNKKKTPTRVLEDHVRPPGPGGFQIDEGPQVLGESAWEGRGRAGQGEGGRDGGTEGRGGETARPDRDDQTGRGGVKPVPQCSLGEGAVLRAGCAEARCGAALRPRHRPQPPASALHTKSAPEKTTFSCPNSAAPSSSAHYPTLPPHSLAVRHEAVGGLAERLLAAVEQEDHRTRQLDLPAT